MAGSPSRTVNDGSIEYKQSTPGVREATVILDPSATTTRGGKTHSTSAGTGIGTGIKTSTILVIVLVAILVIGIASFFIFKKKK